VYCDENDDDDGGRPNFDVREREGQMRHRSVSSPNTPCAAQPLLTLELINKIFPLPNFTQERKQRSRRIARIPTTPATKRTPPRAIC
jgi:hypothetical protein